MMPEPVLEEIAAEVMNYHGSGMSVMEMSHRSAVFQEIRDQAENNLRKLANIPENYKILFIQGGGTLQFSMVPINLLKTGAAGYIETGHWSARAIPEAKKYGDIDIIASSRDKNFSYIPEVNYNFNKNLDYIYICENETIHGTTYWNLPNMNLNQIPLVSDQSSMFLSRPVDVNKYGLIWAGVQKNIGPAGMVIVIIREDLINKNLNPKVPVYLSYQTHADHDSMYNTPNCWSIYCCGKVFEYLIKLGGLEEMARINREKADIFYNFLDESAYFHGTVVKKDRSVMNIPFRTLSPEEDLKCVAAAKQAGFDNLKGHKSVGGLRASIYNAMPKAGVEALVRFLREYEKNI